jgi:hypothetical protein
MQTEKQTRNERAVMGFPGTRLAISRCSQGPGEGCRLELASISRHVRRGYTLTEILDRCEVMQMFLENTLIEFEHCVKTLD